MKSNCRDSHQPPRDPVWFQKKGRPEWASVASATYVVSFDLKRLYAAMNLQQRREPSRVL